MLSDCLVASTDDFSLFCLILFRYSYDSTLDKAHPISPDVCLNPQTQNHHGEIPDGAEQAGLALDVLAAARACGHHPQQVLLPQGQAECRGSPAWGLVANVRQAPTDASGKAERLQHSRNSDGSVRWLQPRGERVLFWSAPRCIHVDSELLPHGQAAHDGGNVCPVLQPGTRLLGYWWDLPWVVLPSEVPPEKGTNERGTQEGGWQFERQRGRWIRQHVLHWKTKEALVPAGEAQLIGSSKGKCQWMEGCESVSYKDHCDQVSRGLGLSCLHNSMNAQNGTSGYASHV